MDSPIFPQKIFRVFLCSRPIATSPVLLPSSQAPTTCPAPKSRPCVFGFTALGLSGYSVSRFLVFKALGFVWEIFQTLVLHRYFFACRRIILEHRSDFLGKPQGLFCKVMIYGRDIVYGWYTMRLPQPIACRWVGLDRAPSGVKSMIQLSEYLWSSHKVVSIAIQSDCTYLFI